MRSLLGRVVGANDCHGQGLGANAGAEVRPSPKREPRATPRRQGAPGPGPDALERAGVALASRFGLRRSRPPTKQRPSAVTTPLPASTPSAAATWPGTRAASAPP